MSEMHSILVIPHACQSNVVVRSRVIAEKLAAQRNRVYLLQWYRRKSDTYLARVHEVLKNLFAREKQVVEASGVIAVTLPRWYFPYKLAKFINSYTINRFVKKQQLDVVINASYYYYDFASTHRAIKPYYIYDVVDNHLHGGAGNLSPVFSRQIESFVQAQIRAADKVLFINHLLRKSFPALAEDKAYYLPNGTELQRFSQVTSADCEAFLKAQGLAGSFVIGYVGNLQDSYTGLDFLLDFFQQLSANYQDVRLLLVGPMSAKQQQQVADCEGVVALGAQPKEQMPLIFSSLSLGVLPFLKTPFTNSATPIKLIEYAAAGKPILSVDLDGLNELALPRLTLCERSVSQWVEAFAVIRTMEHEEKSTLVDSYDWQALTEKFQHEILDELI